MYLAIETCKRLFRGTFLAIFLNPLYCMHIHTCNMFMLCLMFESCVIDFTNLLQ